MAKIYPKLKLLLPLLLVLLVVGKWICFVYTYVRLLGRWVHTFRPLAGKDDWSGFVFALLELLLKLVLCFFVFAGTDLHYVHTG